MGPAVNLLTVYKELAECYERRGQAQMRDRFLVLACDAALSCGQADEAERLRMKLLQANPHHMLKPYASFDQARSAPDVDTYVRNLRLNYSQPVAEDLLRTLRAGGDPPTQPMQRVAPAPAVDPASEATVHLEPPEDRTEPSARDRTTNDVHDGTVTLPAPPTAPPRAGRASDATHPAVPKSRVPTRAEPESPARATRSTAPAPPERPSGSSRSTGSPRAAAKATPRPGRGSSPFAPLGNETGSASARGRQSPDESSEGSGWLASVLLVVVSLIGLAAVGYVIARRS